MTKTKSHALPLDRGRQNLPKSFTRSRELYDKHTDINHCKDNWKIELFRSKKKNKQNCTRMIQLVWMGKDDFNLKIINRPPTFQCSWAITGNTILFSNVYPCWLRARDARISTNLWFSSDTCPGCTGTWSKCNFPPRVPPTLCTKRHFSHFQYTPGLSWRAIWSGNPRCSPRSTRQLNACRRPLCTTWFSIFSRTPPTSTGIGSVPDMSPSTKRLSAWSTKSEPGFTISTDTLDPLG